MAEFAGRHVVVTGASSGIGWHAARMFASDGARVIAQGHRNREGLDTLRAHGDVTVVQADLASPQGLAPLAEAVAGRFAGRVDVLVNNAGSLVQRSPLVEMDEALWDTVMNLNLKSVYLCCRAFVPGMLARKDGAVVNVSSIAGRNGGGPGASAYAAAKGALITLTKGFAKECAPHGVRVNAVAPGVIMTPFHQQFSTPEMLENFRRSIPLGRLGQPEECAEAILFLASSRSRYLIGETLEVNGGMLMD